MASSTRRSADKGGAGNPMVDPRPHVVFIGAGFGGLEAAPRLADQPVDATIIDKNNYHGFWPLLYQVATAELDAPHIAQPVRQLIRNRRSQRFQVGTVRAIDRERQIVVTGGGTGLWHQLERARGVGAVAGGPHLLPERLPQPPDGAV